MLGDAPLPAAQGEAWYTTYRGYLSEVDTQMVLFTRRATLAVCECKPASSPAYRSASEKGPDCSQTTSAPSPPVRLRKASYPRTVAEQGGT